MLRTPQEQARVSWRRRNHARIDGRHVVVAVVVLSLLRQGSLAGLVERTATFSVDTSGRNARESEKRNSWEKIKLLI
jgi:hypothetical protein